MTDSYRPTGSMNGNRPYTPEEKERIKKAALVGFAVVAAILMLIIAFIIGTHKPQPVPTPPRVLHQYTLMRGQSAAMLIGNQQAILVAAHNRIPIYRRGLHGTTFTRVDTIAALNANTDYNLLTAKFFPGDRFYEQVDGTYRYEPAHPGWRR